MSKEIDIFKIQASWLSNIAITVFLLYPIMAVKYIPFGGGVRYMTVLAGPLAIIILLVNYKRLDVKALLNRAKVFLWPFLPLLLGLGFAVLYHHQDLEFKSTIVSVFYGCMIYLAAKELNLSEKQLAYAACIAGFVFFASAFYDVTIMGRARAFAGTYENRFAQFSMIVFGLSAIYILKLKGYVRNIFTIMVGFSMLVTFFAVILTQSRGALLVLPILIIFIIVYTKIPRLFILGGLVFFTVMAIGFLWGNPAYFDRLKLAVDEAMSFFQGNHESTSIGIRLELWRIAFGTISIDRLFGLGRLTFIEMSHVIPALSVSAINVNGHFPPGSWQYHADLAQAIGFGGLLLLLSYIATILLLLKRSLGNVYRVWLVACLIIYGVSELVIFNKAGFAFFIACWALYSAAQDTRLRFSMSQSE